MLGLKLNHVSKRGYWALKEFQWLNFKIWHQDRNGRDGDMPYSLCPGDKNDTHTDLGNVPGTVHDFLSKYSYESESPCYTNGHIYVILTWLYNAVSGKVTTNENKAI